MHEPTALSIEIINKLIYTHQVKKITILFNLKRSRYCLIYRRPGNTTMTLPLSSPTPNPYCLLLGFGQIKKSVWSTTCLPCGPATECESRLLWSNEHASLLVYPSNKSLYRDFNSFNYISSVFENITSPNNLINNIGNVFEIKCIMSIEHAAVIFVYPASLNNPEKCW